MTDQHANQPGVGKQPPASNPSGATDQIKERVHKFDEEGGDQPQAPTQQAVDDELARARDESAGPGGASKHSSPR